MAVLIQNSSLDFWLGASSVIALGVVYQVYQLFQAPSVDAIERQCQKQIPQMGGDNANDTVTIWGMDGPGQECRSAPYGVADSSPFVSRVEGYLRLCQIDYVKKASLGGSENPRQKCPFANVKGIMVDDSERIITTIQNTCHVTVDDNLSEHQAQTGFLVQRLLHHSLYWVLLHQMFNTKEGRRLFAEEMRHNLPPIVSTLVAKLVFRNMHKNLYGCGIGRYPHAEIVKRGQQDVRCLSQILGKNSYILGTQEPTSYDVDVYTWLVLLFSDKAQVANPWVQDVQYECPNLVDYVNRMRQRLFPELKC